MILKWQRGWRCTYRQQFSRRYGHYCWRLRVGRAGDGVEPSGKRAARGKCSLSREPEEKRCQGCWGQTCPEAVPLCCSSERHGWWEADFPVFCMAVVLEVAQAWGREQGGQDPAQVPRGWQRVSPRACTCHRTALPEQLGARTPYLGRLPHPPVAPGVASTPAVPWCLLWAQRSPQESRLAKLMRSSLAASSGHATGAVL